VTVRNNKIRKFLPCCAIFHLERVEGKDDLDVIGVIRKEERLEGKKVSKFTHRRPSPPPPLQDSRDEVRKFCLLMQTSVVGYVQITAFLPPRSDQS